MAKRSVVVRKARIKAAAAEILLPILKLTFLQSLSKPRPFLHLLRLEPLVLMLKWGKIRILTRIKARLDDIHRRGAENS